MKDRTFEAGFEIESRPSHSVSARRRSLLFVPGADSRKLEKAASSNADALIFDLEDSVAPDSKEQARTLVAERLRADPGNSDCIVRVNGDQTAYFERDVAEVVAAGARTLMLPKATPAALSHARLLLASVEQDLSLEAGAIRLLGLVEAAMGVAHLPLLIDDSERLDALCFGNADFSLDMGLPDGDLSTGIVYHARCSLAITAVAAGLNAVDGVCLAIRDDEAFEAETRSALSLGFSGKLCIHPRQVAIANEVFTPTSDQIDTARRMLAAALEAERGGVFSLDGKMVDAPVLALQKRLLERAGHAGELEAASETSSARQKIQSKELSPK
ncbi:MAG: CoA ester lyase [Myxococcota bacterium]